MPLPPPQALKRLLTSLFTGQELRRFLHFRSDGPQLVADLPAEGAPDAEVIHQATEAMLRRSWVDDAFFEHLAAERPRARARIQALQRRWPAHEGTPPPVSAPASGAGRISIQQQEVEGLGVDVSTQFTGIADIEQARVRAGGTGVKLG